MTWSLEPGVHCLAFDQGDRSVLAIWDDRAPPEGRPFPLQLGQASRQVDLWGRSTSLARDERGRQIVTLHTHPTFVPNVERWLVEFRASIVLGPATVEFGLARMDHTLELASLSSRTISGQVRLMPPEDWELDPQTLTFHLMGQRRRREAVEVRYPPSEPAGRKTIVARVELGNSGYSMDVPLSFELGLSDLEVSGRAIVVGNDLILRHTVTSRADKILSFQGGANVPGREQQYRPFTNLHPGDTMTAEYRFLGGAALGGRNVRLLLRELNDGPRFHNLELEVP
jgi:hypothetical protein